jgi:hypothetical protein
MRVAVPPLNDLTRRISGIILACIALAIAACGGPGDYTTPVGKFRDASAVVIQTTKVYLTELNKTERDHYLNQQAATRQQIKASDIASVQVFSSDGIRARVKALSVLSDYTELLYTLATSQAPTTIKSKASDLQTALTSLSGEVTKLSGGDAGKFQGAVGKAFPVIGKVLEVFVTKKINDGLKAAVDEGAQPVNDLIEALSADVTVAYERKRQDYTGHRTAAINEYNREFLKGPQADPQRLQTYADAIADAEDQIEAFLTAEPGEGLAAMKKAHDALHAFANQSKHTVHDFASFVDAMEAFANAAKRAGDAVHKSKSEE